jgi:hypothetical protein
MSLKKYIDENNKKPVKNSKNKETSKLSFWLGHKVQNYKLKKEIMKNEIIYSTWMNFIKEYKKYFNKKL